MYFMYNTTSYTYTHKYIFVQCAFCFTSNLFAGTYTIEVTDELGCLEQKDIELTQPTAIEIDFTKTDVTCYGEADGSIDISVNGGNPPYQISWSNLGNGFSQSNLSAGNYRATIVDQNLCEANITITIEQPIFFIAPIVSPISCNDANDASIDLNLTGGVAPITVLWSDDPSAGVQRNNLSPIVLGPKEGLGLINGTQVSTAFALAGLFKVWRIARTSIVSGALSTEAAMASHAPFVSEIHELRGQLGQISVAKGLRNLLAKYM